MPITEELERVEKATVDFGNELRVNAVIRSVMELESRVRELEVLGQRVIAYLPPVLTVYEGGKSKQGDGDEVS